MNSLVSGRHDKKNAHSFNLVSTLWPSCLPNTIQRPKVRYIVRPFLSHRIVFSFLNIHESYQWSSMRFEVNSFLINQGTYVNHSWTCDPESIFLFKTIMPRLRYETPRASV